MAGPVCTGVALEDVELMVLELIFEELDALELDMVEELETVVAAELDTVITDDERLLVLVEVTTIEL